MSSGATDPLMKAAYGMNVFQAAYTTEVGLFASPIGVGGCRLMF